LYEKSVSIAPVLPGLTAGRLAGWLASRQNSAKFKIFKIIYWMKYIQLFAMFNKGTVLL